MKYAKDIDELKCNASLWWPTELSDLERSSSVIPRLLETQDEFISLLTLSKDNPYQIFDILKNASLPGNIFLKHLVVLADFGGEKLSRINREFDSIFKKDKKNKNELSEGHYLEYVWDNKDYKYNFSSLPSRGLTNSKLKIDGNGMSRVHPLDNLMKDVSIIILFGALLKSDSVPEILEKCSIGILLGKSEEIKTFVKQRYIHVSRITGGAEANSLGQIAQTYVKTYLKSKLPNKYEVSSGSVDLKDRDGLLKKENFDIIVKGRSELIGIEVSFQVTTNSTIERKARQANLRYNRIKQNGCHIGYIIDGAGNFQRETAIKEICSNSDVTVAYGDSEFDILVEYILENLS